MASVLASLRRRWERLTLRLALLALSAVAGVIAIAQPAPPPEKTTFKVAWSVSVGGMPWDYAQSSGILRKWADKYGITIQLVQVNDYIDAINRYTAGAFDACAMTNMDMLTIPSAGGVDSTALIVGDYSNGNDGIVLKGAGRKLADIKGQTVNLTELSVSHYLLARALASVGLKERDVTIVNTPDEEIVGSFAAPRAVATVAWKPQLASVMASPRATLVFDSSQIPGEILDLMVVNSKVLKDNPRLGKALVGAWYETLAVLQRNDASATGALEAMGKAFGTDAKGFSQQLATVHLYLTPPSGVAAVTSAELLARTDRVRQFSFDHGLLGAAAKSVDAVGIQFPGGRTLGSPKNIKMRFDSSYMKLAMDGKL